MTDWKTDLQDFYQSLENKATQTTQQQNQEKLAVQNFFSNIVTPAFDELKTGFEQLGRRVETTIGHDSASIIIYKGEDLEYDLAIKTTENYVYPVTPGNIIKGQSIGQNSKFKKSFKEMTKDDLVQSFLSAYKGFISRHSS